ncbi:hypothetical protein [Geobacillus stearothermophilus]
MNPDYWRGFNAGMKEAEKKASMAAAQMIAELVEGMKDIPGIGEVLYSRIVDYVNNYRPSWRESNESTKTL